MIFCLPFPINAVPFTKTIQMIYKLEIVLIIMCGLIKILTNTVFHLLFELLTWSIQYLSIL